jgi:predicted lipid-binding transport protein (Tim44 family)
MSMRLGLPEIIICLIPILIIVGIVFLVIQANRRKRQQIYMRNAGMIAPDKPSAQPPIPAAPIPAAQAAPSPQASTPTIPVLPANCPHCLAPIAMNTVSWSGPLNSRCPYCGSGIDIKWKKLGE